MNLRTPIFPTWCPGCGDFGIWGALKNALAKLAIPEEKLVIVFDVGCSGNMADFIRVYGFHSLHGRAVPVAEGIAMANSGLTVIVIGGDGGLYGEGMGHLIAAAKTNLNMTVIVHNNQTYGLTKGQASPTTAVGIKTSSTPTGVIEHPINPLGVTLTAGATWAGRGYAPDIPGTTDLIIQAVKHHGFAHLDIFQPCVSFNKFNTQAWFIQHLTKLPDDYVPDNITKAWEQSNRTDLLPVGLFYKNTQEPTYHQKLSSTLQNTPLTNLFPSKVDLTPALSEFT